MLGELRGGRSATGPGLDPRPRHPMHFDDPRRHARAVTLNSDKRVACSTLAPFVIKWLRRASACHCNSGPAMLTRLVRPPWASLKVKLLALSLVALIPGFAVLAYNQVQITYARQ